MILEVDIRYKGEGNQEVETRDNEQNKAKTDEQPSHEAETEERAEDVVAAEEITELRNSFLRNTLAQESLLIFVHLRPSSVMRVEKVRKRARLEMSLHEPAIIKRAR